MGAHPVLRIPNVIRGTINIAELKFTTLPDDGARALLLQEGDLLFVRTNGRREYTGRCAVYRGEPKDALFASYLIRVRIRAKVSVPDFVQAYTETAAGRNGLSGKASYATGGRFNINSQIIKKLRLPCPLKGEQADIACMLKAADEKLRAEEARKHALAALFSTLLHQLVTGKIRVNDLTCSGTAVVA